MNKQFGLKVLFALLWLLAIVFADTTLSLINALIQLKINILGFFLEPLLQWIFDMPLRQAQIISAWIYLLIASFLCWLLLRKTYQAYMVIFHTARQTWLTKNRRQKLTIMLLIILLMSASLKLIFIFVL